MSELFGGASDYSSSGIDSLADAQYGYDDNIFCNYPPFHPELVP